MSIELEKPDTITGMVDAAANYVAQIRIALELGDVAHASHCAEKAERLLFNATCKLEESNAN